VGFCESRLFCFLSPSLFDDHERGGGFDGFWMMTKRKDLLVED